MASVKFYHLTQSPLERAAEMLLSRAVGMGMRVFLRGCDSLRLSQLDQWLWLNPRHGFLPHGMSDAPDSAEHPLLLGQGALPEGMKALMLIEGAEVDPAEIALLERVWILFDGLDGAALDQARAQWRSLKAAGVEAEYWSEESGRWERKQ